MSPFDAMAELARELERRMTPAQAVEFLVTVRENLTERWPPGKIGSDCARLVREPEAEETA